jgi:rhamnosyltransferase
MIGIGAQTVMPHEVILVDSGSTDETVAIARAYGARVVDVERAEFTFGRALNRGCAAATGDVCVIPSAHVYPVCDTWLEELVEPFRDSRVALSYGRQRGDETNKFSEHQIFQRWFPAQSACPQTTHFCNNANCAIRRSMWEARPYDEDLTGLEDLAWAKAVRERGAWIAYVAEAEVVHVHDETWEQIQNRYRREAMALRSIDEHAHFSRGDFVRLLARNVLSDVRAASTQGVLRKELGSILMFRYNQLWGTYRGFNGPPEVSAQLRARFFYPGDDGRAGVERMPPENMIDYGALEAEAHRARLEDGHHFWTDDNGSGNGGEVAGPPQEAKMDRRAAGPDG